MRSAADGAIFSGQTPVFDSRAHELAKYLKTLPVETVQKVMALSPAKAQTTHDLLQRYSSQTPKLPAIDSFLGDIYSGLQTQTFSSEDRAYANDHLFILSGLYGVLRALDSIQPYRLEMGYTLPGNTHDTTQPNITSLYTYWGNAITEQLPTGQPIINLSAKEYTKNVLKNVNEARVISPKFLTVSPKTGKPTFVTVHAKVARGAYAGWLIRNRVEDVLRLQDFTEIGYSYNDELSTPEEPVFVAQEFKGLGLSVRLTPTITSSQI